MNKRFITTCILVFAGMFVASTGWGMDAGPDAKQPKAAATNASPACLFAQLERDIPSLYLINGLYLTQEQAGKLAALIEDVKSIEERCDQKCAKLIKARQREFEKEKDEIVLMASRHSGVDQKKLDRSSRSERLQKAREEIGELRGRRYNEVNDLADKAFALLSDSQQKIVKTFSPCFIPSNDFKNPERVGQAIADTSDVEKVLATMRKALTNVEPASAVSLALDTLVPYVLQKRYIPYSDQAARSVRDELSGPLQAMVPRLKELDDSGFEMEKKALATKVFTLQNPDDPASIRWKVAHYILDADLLEVMKARAAGAKDMAAIVPPAAKNDSSEVDARDQALRIAGLVRGLDLTPEQSVKILAIVREAQENKAKIDADVVKAVDEAVETYSQLRNELAAGQASREAENHASQSHNKVKHLRDDTTTETMLKLEGEMDQVLTAKQVALLSGAAKEVPKSDSSAGAVDRSMNRSRAFLADVRRETGMDFAAKKEGLCRDFIKAYIKEQDMDAGAVDIDAETQRLIEVVDRVRALNQSDYGTQREELAAELCPRRAKARPPVYGPHYVDGKPVPTLGASTKLLLLCDVTREILEKMAPKSDR